MFCAGNMASRADVAIACPCPLSLNRTTCKCVFAVRESPLTSVCVLYLPVAQVPCPHLCCCSHPSLLPVFHCSLPVLWVVTVAACCLTAHSYDIMDSTGIKLATLYVTVSKTAPAAAPALAKWTPCRPSYLQDTRNRAPKEFFGGC